MKNIKTVTEISRLTFKLALYFIVSLIILEVALQVSSKIFLIFIGQPRIKKYAEDNGLNIVIIGDSWTEGAGSKNGKSYGYFLAETLNKKYPQKKIKVFNLGRGSFNSAESLVDFIQNLKKIKPDILVAMMGMNNGWNRQDVELSFKYIQRKLNQLPLDNIFIRRNYLKNTRIYRLASILYFEMFIKNKKMEFGHPYDEFAGQSKRKCYRHCYRSSHEPRNRLHCCCFD